eukprot:5300373-Prymnesium_polylepis.1
MAGQGREDVGEVSAAAEQAAPNAPGERMRGCASVPSPSPYKSPPHTDAQSHNPWYTQHIHPTPHTHQPVTHVRSARMGRRATSHA